MSWSTREIAELAGTSLRAIRHYHEIGLLAEPERHANGYKKYGTAHLVRVLRIKRLTDLGFSLSQIASLGDADDPPLEALRGLDAELAGAIERLKRTRLELELILRRSHAIDPPSEHVPAVANADLPEADRSVAVVLSRILGPEARRAWVDLLRETPADPLAAELDRLPADADEETRQDLAERLAPYCHALRAESPRLWEATADARAGAGFVGVTAHKAVNDVLNPAQIDVIARLRPVLDGSSGTDSI